MGRQHTYENLSTVVVRAEVDVVLCIMQTTRRGFAVGPDDMLPWESILYRVNVMQQVKI